MVPLAIAVLAEQERDAGSYLLLTLSDTWRCHWL